MIDGINTCLKQDMTQKVDLEAGIAGLNKLLEDTDHEKV
jgi:hypothetical protein